MAETWNFRHPVTRSVRRRNPVIEWSYGLSTGREEEREKICLEEKLRHDIRMGREAE